MSRTTTHSASVPSDQEIRLGREGVLAVKAGHADEVRIYRDRGRVRTREINYGNTRWASSRD